MVIRKALDADRTAIMVLLGQFRMIGDIDPQSFLVAEESGTIVGVVCLECRQGDLYLRAMAVAPDWQGQGVGQKLVENLIDGAEQVRLVARGTSVQFYQKVGFRSTAWTDICEELVTECRLCPDMDSCKPQPMIFDAKVKG